MKNRLAVAMIVSDQWTEEEVGRTLGSVDGIADGIFVSYNGRRGDHPDWDGLSGTPITWGRERWTDDFAAARNHSFSLVPRDRFDWIMWLDTDDVFHVDGSIRDLWDKVDEYTQGIILRYDYAVEPDTGIVVVQQWRERILRADWPWTWKHPIHEACIAPPGTQVAKLEGAWVEHQRYDAGGHGARTRNRRIIARALREDPDDARMQFYYANETLAEASSSEDPHDIATNADLAIAAYRKFLANMEGQPLDEVYSAALRIANCFELKRDWNEAMDAYLQALKFYPAWHDAYVGLAKCCMEIGDWARMRDFAQIAIDLPDKETVAGTEPMNASFHPWFLKGIAMEELGELDEAELCYVRALSIWEPPNGALQQRIAQLAERRRAPKPEDIRKRHRGRQPDRSICFFTETTAEHWNYDTLAEGGHGGAETMTLEMARRFAADGWRSVIFGSPGRARGIQEGVELYETGEWLADEPFTVFVSSRSPRPFLSPVNARFRALWMHDVNVGQGMVGISGSPYEPDAYVALSDWHRSHAGKLYGLDPARVHIVPNGIDRDAYPERGARDWDPRFIYASSPDRGLEQLLSMWPAIREIEPVSQLDVYYGWSFIDRLLAQGRGQHLLEFKRRIMGAIEDLGGEEGGIRWHDRVDPATLARSTYSSNFWAYPTDFMETFCITAVQMQAAGVIPIYSDLAALRETVASRRFAVEGWPRNSAYQSQFLAAVEDALGSDEALLLGEAGVGREHALGYTLDNSYRSWQDLFSLGNAWVPAAQAAVPKEIIGA